MERCVPRLIPPRDQLLIAFAGLDGHYLFLSIIGIFALSFIEAPGPIVKTLLASLLLTGLIIPITRQVLLPALPVITWAVLFYSARYAPHPLPESWHLV
jgi:hypothetical protein